MPSPAAAAWSYADCSAASDSRSMSPTMSRTVTSPRWRTTTFSSPALIGCLSFRGGLPQVHDEMHCVVQLVARRAQVVHHVADQEQTPAPGVLQAGQLGVQIGVRRVRDRPVAALVGD